MPSTPPPPPKSIASQSHLAPSLPNSPLPKRPKTMSSADPPSANAVDPPPPSLSQSPPLLIKKLAPSAKAPTRGSAFAAGYDLYSARGTKIPARGKGMVDTEIAIAVPEGTCELLWASIRFSRCSPWHLGLNGRTRDWLLTRSLHVITRRSNCSSEWACGEKLHRYRRRGH